MNITSRGFCFRLKAPLGSIKYSNMYLSKKMVHEIGLMILERSLVMIFGEFKLDVS